MDTVDLSALWTAAAPVLLVFGLRTLDVQISTFRVVMVVQGRRTAAASLAFLAACLELVSLATALTDLTVPKAIGYAAGVAAGTWLGMAIVHHMRLGMVTVRAFCDPSCADAAADAVRSHGWGVTIFEGRGQTGPRSMLLTIVRRRHARIVCEVVKAVDGTAMVAVDNAPAPGSTIGGLLGSRL